MKKFLFMCFALISVLIATSCVDVDIDLMDSGKEVVCDGKHQSPDEKVNVEITKEVESVEVEGRTKNLKSGVPVYVKGMNVSVGNNDFEVPDLFFEFLFDDEGPMIAEGLTLGSNTFYAKSIPAFPIVETGEKNLEMPDELPGNLVDKAFHYSNQLEEKYPIFVEYSDRQEVSLFYDVNNSVHFMMKPLQGRFNIVVESPIDMRAELWVTHNGKTYNVKGHFSRPVAFVLNNEMCTDGSNVSVTLLMETKGGSEVDVIMRDYYIDAGVNKTRVLVYGRDSPVESIGFSASFSPIFEDNGGELIE